MSEQTCHNCLHEKLDEELPPCRSCGAHDNWQAVTTLDELTQLRADLARAEGERERESLMEDCQGLRFQKNANWEIAVTNENRAEVAKKECRLLREQLAGEKESYALSDKIATERMHKAEQERDTLKAECERLKGIEAERIEIGGKYQAVLTQLNTSREEGVVQGMERAAEILESLPDGSSCDDYYFKAAKLIRAESSTLPRTYEQGAEDMRERAAIAADEWEHGDVEGHVADLIRALPTTPKEDK